MLAPAPAPAPIDIYAAPDGRLLRLTFSGMLTEEALARFERDLDAARRRAARPGWGGWPRVLVDVRDAQVQTRSAADQLRARMLRFQGFRRRIAFVASDAQLLRLQVGRLAAGEEHRFFADVAGAEGWLAEA